MPNVPSSVWHPAVRFVVIASSVVLLHGPSAQSPISHVLTGLTMDELLPVRSAETRGEGLRHAAAEGLEATPARAVRQPPEMFIL